MKASIVFLIICSLQFAQSAVSFGKYAAKLDGRIVGGIETTIEEHPYQVSIRYDGEHSCGGSILDENTILTACHCVHRLKPTKFAIRVGNTIHSEGEEHKVSQIIEHQYYNKDAAYDNDVAILKLATPLMFSERVQPIELQPIDEEVEAGVDATVSGWGALQENDDETPDVLREVDVRLITYKQCEEAYGADLTIHMMCAQSPLHDSCQGDSGGPLVLNNRLIGVVSWGEGCARPGFPGVYAKVSSLHEWILAHK